MIRLDFMWRVLIVNAIGTFMVILDTTIVNIALPKIITVFGTSVDQAQLVLTGYMVALAIVVPTAPYFSQTYGNKRIYLLSMVMFTIGSALCGLAWDVPSLVVARVLQGLGGGFVQPVGMATMMRITPVEQRGSIMSKYSIPIMMAPLLGPSLGGFLVESVGWRWVFFINLPFGLLGVFLGLAWLRDFPRVSGLRFDYLGFVLAAVASCGALLGLSDVPEKGWSHPAVATQLLLGAIALPLFIAWQLYYKHPLLNLRLFAIPAFSLAAMVNFVVTAAFFGGVFLLPVFLQNVRGLGALDTGMLMMPQAIGTFMAMQIAGRLFDRIGPRPLILTGLSTVALTTWMLSFLDVNTPDSTLRVILVLRGLATGITMMPSFTSWLAAAPPSQTPSATAVNNVCRQLFAAFGTAMYATVLQNRISFHFASMSMFVLPDAPSVTRLLAEGQQFALSHGLSLAQGRALAVGQLLGQVRQAATVRGFDDCFLVGAAACLIGLVPAFFMRKGPLRRHGGAPAGQPAHGPAAPNLGNPAGRPAGAPVPSAAD